MNHDLTPIINRFQFVGELLGVRPYRTGHIHDTFVVRFRSPGGSVQRFLLQRINTTVFQQPERLMENIERVTAHLKAKIAASGGDPMRKTLTLVPAKKGNAFAKTAKGDYWRAFYVIEGARTYDTSVSLDHVTEVAKTCGRFLKYLSDLPLEQLHETIPDFHHTAKRYETLTEAIKRDVKDRASKVEPEIAFVEERADDVLLFVDLLAQGKLPERAVHNDTKINNVMIDRRTGEGLWIIDLDTIMPGLSLYDFGDLVRSAANPAAEDERDLSRVELDLSAFERCVSGYREGAGDLLTPSELNLFPLSAKLIALELGMRFLTDYVQGDVYFKIHRERQNLNRCRVQFRLVEDIESKLDQMTEIVNRHRRPLAD